MVPRKDPANYCLWLSPLGVVDKDLHRSLLANRSNSWETVYAQNTREREKTAGTYYMYQSVSTPDHVIPLRVIASAISLLNLS